MVEDVKPKSTSDREKSKAPQTSSPRPHWYSPPGSIKHAFDKFPLTTYTSNTLPRRSPHDRKKNTLHVFASVEAARQGRPSHNPACLKWQAYLKFAGIEFVTVSSNNHASPSGSLPFLLHPEPRGSFPPTPIPSGKIARWTTSQTHREEEDVGMRHEAYTSLLDHRIRSAWLFHLYLDAANYKQVALPLYIATASSNLWVQFVLGRQLQQAAREELIKYTAVIDGQELLDGANRAFEALSSLLGDNEFFFGHGRPGLFDASVFAYTHLILSDSMKWENTSMTNDLEKYKNLVQHQDRLSRTYFPS
jgi:metaxin